MMIDWFVFVTPLILLPILLLLVFVGCQYVAGIDQYEEGAEEPEELEYPAVTFSYAANLPGPPPGMGVQFIRWNFTTTSLTYPDSSSVSPSFDPGTHRRGQGSPNPVQAGGETVDHGSIGSPDGGVLICDCRVQVFNEPSPRMLEPRMKGPGEVGFPQFQLSSDLVLT